MGMMAGKKCLIMGIANKRSIAWGIAQSLHREGAEVAFTYQTERLKENVQELADSLGEGIALFPCDVTVEGQVEALFAALGEKWGQLDTLVHSLAFARTEDIKADFVDITKEGWRIAQEISAWSLIAVAKGAKPLLEAAGGGSIITLTYQASTRVVDKYNIMAAAKAALECNVRYLAHELGQHNIRVNAISAGPIKTLASSAIKGVSGFKEIIEERAPLRRNVTIEEVGDVALFLASPLARAVTGDIHFVDSGFHIMGI
jgi:enoyl-[acyl-carrier protein] reductase I